MDLIDTVAAAIWEAMSPGICPFAELDYLVQRRYRGMAEAALEAIGAVGYVLIDAKLQTKYPPAAPGTG